MNPKELLITSHLSKATRSRKHILTDISFAVAEGQIVSVLGPNGAGKSALMQCALGLARPSSGSVEYFGGTSLSEALLHIAYAPAQGGLFSWMTGTQHLDFYRWSRRRSFSPLKATLLAKSFDLPLTIQASKLSTGQRTMLSFLLAFAIDARLFIIDEPLLGLDTENHKVVLDALIEKAADGCGILFSTHDIASAERVSDVVLILDNGRSKFYEHLADVKLREVVWHALYRDKLPDTSLFGRLPEIRSVNYDAGFIAVQTRNSAATAAFLQKSGAVHLTSCEPSLQGIYDACVGPMRSLPAN